MSRYDLLLAVLPLPVLLGAFASLVTSVPDPLGIGIGSLPSALLLVYAVTVGAPTPIERSA
jgi:hypothetical protein